MNFIALKKIDLMMLKIVGSDGTNVNTGPTGGIIRSLKKELNRPLQWAICQLHNNELSLRHLIEHLDGKTTSPYAFSGPIGTNPEECHKFEVIYFEPFETTLTHQTVDVKLLSAD